MGWPDGSWLFDHLRDLPAPIRLEDFPGYLRSLGLSNHETGDNVRRLGELRPGHIGHFSLGDRQDGEALTGEDEEILMLFLATPETITRPGASLPGAGVDTRSSRAEDR